MDSFPIIIIRFALYADLMVLTGLVAFSLYALNENERRDGTLPLTAVSVVLSAWGLLLSALGMPALVAAMTGSSILAPDLATLRSIVGETAIGSAWIVRMAAVAAAFTFTLMLKRTQSGRLVHLGLLLSTSLAIATLVWTGHAGATEGPLGTAHKVSDIVHLLAASIWIGGIAAFCWLLFRANRQRIPARVAMLHRALARFSRIGTMAVALIVATGIVNGLILFGLPVRIDCWHLPMAGYCCSSSCSLPRCCCWPPPTGGG